MDMALVQAQVMYNRQVLARGTPVNAKGNSTQNNENESNYLPNLRLSGTGSWTAFALSVVEAACVFAVMAAKSGLLLGSIAGFMAGWTVYLHKDFIRIPALLAAIILTFINVFILWRFFSIRNSPQAAWRKRPLTKRERLRISMVLFVSVITLLIAFREIYLHRLGHHTIM